MFLDAPCTHSKATLGFCRGQVKVVQVLLSQTSVLLREHWLAGAFAPKDVQVSTEVLGSLTGFTPLVARSGETAWQNFPCVFCPPPDLNLNAGFGTTPTASVGRDGVDRDKGNR